MDQRSPPHRIGPRGAGSRSTARPSREAVVWELRHWPELFAGTLTLGPLLVSFAASVLFGWLAIDGLLRLVRRFSFFPFAAYRVILAVVVWQVLA